MKLFIKRKKIQTYMALCEKSLYYRLNVTRLLFSFLIKFDLDLCYYL